MERFTTEFLECIRIKRENSAYVTKKRDFCVLSLRLSGSADFEQKGTTFHANSENLLYFPANIDYFQKCKKEELIAIHFRSNDFPGQKITSIFPKNMELIRSLIESLYETWATMAPGYEYKCRSIFYELMYHIKSDISPAPSSRIAPSLAYLHKHYRNPDISVSDIAAVSCVSEVYFRKLFRQSYHISPVKYINELRIDYAKALLRGCYCSVEEAAHRCGFNHSKYFSNVFYKRTGTTPGKYSKSETM